MNIVRAEVDQEIAALDECRLTPPARITRPSDAAVLDSAGIAVSSTARPNEQGNLRITLSAAIKICSLNTFELSQRRDHDPEVRAVDEWLIGELSVHWVSPGKHEAGLECLLAMAHDLQRLRFGGWHFDLKQWYKFLPDAYGTSLVICNPLADDQLYSYILWEQVTQGKHRDRKLKQTQKLANLLAAIPTVPQRPAADETNAVLARMQSQAEPDLPTLIQARWPALSGIELAQAISRAFDSYQDAEDLHALIEGLGPPALAVPRSQAPQRQWIYGIRASQSTR